MERKMHLMKTGFGNVMLTPTDGKHIYVSTDRQLTDAPCIKVNGVDYHIGAHIYLQSDGEWRFVNPMYPMDHFSEPHLSRIESFRNGKYDSNPSFAAKTRVRNALELGITEWVKEHPKEMGEAKLVRLKEEWLQAQNDMSDLLGKVKEKNEKIASLRKKIDEAELELYSLKSA